MTLVALPRNMRIRAREVALPYLIRSLQVPSQFLPPRTRLSALAPETRQIGIIAAARVRNSLWPLQRESIFRRPQTLAVGFGEAQAAQEAGRLALLLA